MKNILKWFVIGIMVLSLGACSDNNTEVSSAEIVKKLQEFTTVDKSQEKCSFNYNEEWVLTYASMNEFVNFKEKAIESCFENYIGENCLYEGGASDGGFAYDLGDNAVRVYFDIEIDEGNLYFINYDLNKEELTMRVGKNDYYVSDELIDWLEDYGFFDVVEKDIQTFKEKIEENGLNIDDLVSMKLDDVAKCLE